MNIDNATIAAKKLQACGPDIVWTPLPINERLRNIRWSMTDLLHAAEMAPPATVRVAEAFARQRFVRLPQLFWFIDRIGLDDLRDFGTDEIIVRWQGGLLIMDGHHRFAALQLCGIEESTVRLVELDDAGLIIDAAPKP